MKIAIASGYFNPITPAHCDYFRRAREISSALWVIVNNDYQAFSKRGTMSFQPEQDRLAIVRAVRYVDRAELSVDRDSSVCLTIEQLIKEALAEGHEPFMAKGGDSRVGVNIPEVKVCEQYGVKCIDGLGEKTHSSSDYLKRVRE